MPVEFLSEDWVGAVEAGLKANDGFKSATKGQRARVQQIVTSGDGELCYWIRIDNGEVSMGSGRIDDPSVTITADHDTAVALAKGDLSATAAFMAGRVEVSNIMSAMGLQGALSQFGAVVKEIETEY